METASNPTTTHITTLGTGRPEGGPSQQRYAEVGDVIIFLRRGQYHASPITKVGITTVTTSYYTATMAEPRTTKIKHIEDFWQADQSKTVAKEAK